MNCSNDFKPESSSSQHTSLNQGIEQFKINDLSNQDEKSMFEPHSQCFYPVRIGIVGLSYPQKNIIKAIHNSSSLCSFVGDENANTLLQDDFPLESFNKNKCIDEGNILPISIEDLNILSKVDAIYIEPSMETSLKKEFIRKALKNEKHVIVDLPLPFSSSEYVDLIQSAQIAHKFIQDGAAFVHNQGIEEFIEQVTTKDRFGCIKNINATFCVYSSDTMINRYIYLDNNHEYGCIGVLGWICVRMGILIYTRAGYGTIKSAQVIWNEQNGQGVPVDAYCVITFDQGKTLSFECSFTRSSRQLVEVFGEFRSASMVDFALSNNAFSCFRVHEPCSQRGHHHHNTVERLESIECKAGPHQTVMMLRNFAQIVRGIETYVVNSSAGWGDGPESMKAVELTSMSSQTQKVIDALMESIRQDGTLITFP